MPDEVLALLIITIIMSFVLGIIRSWQKFELKKLELEPAEKSRNSLTTSELEKMIEDTVSNAVAAANQPMKDDLESLAMRLDQIDGGGQRITLDDDGDVQEKTVGRTVRRRER